MTIIERKGSEVTIVNSEGETWLTRRKKLRRDSRRRKLRSKSVHYIPIKRIPTKGDWLFTCSMKPVQFGEWEHKDPADYGVGHLTEAELHDFQHDDFISLDGSSHSRTSCSLKLISTAYAEWFIKHQVWELFDINNQDWDEYEKAVKLLCQAYKIKYEGY